MGLLRPNPTLADFSPQRQIDTKDEMVALLTIAEYRDSVKDGFLIDYDGFGYPAAKSGENYYDDPRFDIYPSMKGADIPPGATHINWFNR